MDENLESGPIFGPTETGAYVISVHGERLVLLPERAVYWPSQSALLVADLHWGKDEAFRQRGSPLPPGVLGSDLERLSRCIKQWAVEQVYVLGDLIHNRDGVSGEVIEQVAIWRATHPVEIKLVPGNHDRHLARMPAEFGVEVLEPELEVGSFTLTHDPTAAPQPSKGYAIGGHVHPQFRIRGRSDQIRLPCFYFGPNHAILPAFSEFAGSHLIEAERSANVFVTDSKVVLRAPNR